jgi:hypothetical protein
VDRQGKGLYARCAKLSMLLAHLRKFANYWFLTTGSFGTYSGTPLGPDIDADYFVS